MTIYRNKRSIHGKPYTPFFYVIGWKELNRWYVGSRTQNSDNRVAHPDELMVTYFTSSKNYVHPFIEQHGLPDVVWTFPCKTAEESKYNEKRIMDEFRDFVLDGRWLNKAKGRPIQMDDEVRALWRSRHSAAMKTAAYERTTAHRVKMSEALKGIKRTREHQQALERHHYIHEYQGELYRTRDIAVMAGIHIDTVRWRLKKGWDMERIISTPPTAQGDKWRFKNAHPS